MKKQTEEHWYKSMSKKEKREWYITLIGILLGLAGCCMVFYYVIKALKEIIYKQ